MESIDHWLREPARVLAPDAVLSQPVAMLQGVTPAAERALANVGITTILDLGASALFGVARSIADAADRVDQLGAPGPLPGDLLDDEARGASAASVAAMHPEVLRSLTPGAATLLRDALPADTVRDLGYWPPAVAARRLVNIAYGGEDVAADPEAPQELQPRMGRLPVDRVQYDVLLFESVLHEAGALPNGDPRATAERDTDAAEALAGFDGIEFPLDLTEALLGKGFQHPGFGFVLTVAQSWYSVGLSLGQLLHSLALAPGEATRIAVVDWSRRVATATGEQIDESEALSAELERNRSVTEVTKAVNSEAQKGFASFNTTGAAWGIGGGAAGAASKGTAEGAAAINFGFSRTDAEGKAFASSQGQRDVAADMTQRAHDKTQQFASLSRSRRASIVSEVSVTEAERLSTRIVANYNHMHALSVLYFEVVQLYRVVTECIASEPVLYVPVRPLNFDEPGLVDRYRPALARAALSVEARNALLGIQTKAPKPIVDADAAVGSVEMAFFAPSLTPELYTQRGERLRDTALRKAFGDGAVVDANRLRYSDRHARLAEVQVGSVDATQRSVVEALVITASAGSTQLLPFQKWARPPRDPVKYLPEPGDSLTAYRVLLPSGWNRRDRSFVLEGEATWRWDQEASLGALSFGPRTRFVFELLDPKTAQPTGETVHFDMPQPITAASGRMRLATALYTSEAVADNPATQPPPPPPFDLSGHLRANALHYTMALLRLADPSLLGVLLGALKVGGRSLLGQVDPVPLATVGNYLVFRWPSIRLSPWWEKLRIARGLVDAQARHVVGRREALVPVASGGVFAEAVQGRFNSAEKLDLSRFWNWQDSPMPLVPPEIAPLQAGIREQAGALTPSALGSANLQQQTAPNLPDPSAVLGKAIDAASKGDSFRDMSGLNKLMESGGQAMTLAAQGAQEFMKTAMASVSAYGARVNEGKKMDDAAKAQAAKAEAEKAKADKAGAPATGGGTGGTGGGTGGPGTGPTPAGTTGDTPPTSSHQVDAFSGRPSGAAEPTPAKSTDEPRNLRLAVRVVRRPDVSSTGAAGQPPVGIDLSGELQMLGLYSVERPDGDVDVTLSQGVGTIAVRLTTRGTIAIQAILGINAVEGTGGTLVPHDLVLPGTSADWLRFALDDLLPIVNRTSVTGVLLPPGAAEDVQLELSAGVSSWLDLRRQLELLGLEEEANALIAPFDIDLSRWLGATPVNDAALRDMRLAIGTALRARRDAMQRVIRSQLAGSQGSAVLGGHVSFAPTPATLTIEPEWRFLLDTRLRVV